MLFVDNGKRSLEMMAHGVRLPGSESVATLMRAVVELIGRDESRHIAFGQHCLRRRLAACDASQRHSLEQRALVSARLMYGAFSKRSDDFRRLGMSPVEVMHRIWDAMRRQLGRLDFDLGDAV